MGDRKEQPSDEKPRILRVNRRGFLGRTVAAVAAGALVSSSADANRTTNKQETKLDRFHLFIEPRPFKYPVAEVYPVLTGDDPRLVATSNDDWLAMWEIEKPDEPRFKGKKRGRGTVQVVNRQRPFRRLPGEPNAVSENAAAVGWYERKPARIEVHWKTGRIASILLPDDRGKVETFGLGADASGLAVAMEVGGVLLFDLRPNDTPYVAEYYDSGIGVNHVLAVGEDTSRWAFTPCVCDIVSAQSDSQEGATVSRYDKLTGTVTTYTLPCGSEIPAGAVCVCNCVAAPIFDVVRTICTCNLVCTCDTVATGTTTYTYTYWYPN